MDSSTSLDVSRETSDRLSLFESLLTRWSERINLIGPHDLARFWDRHIADSLNLARLIPASGQIVDLGSGAGFPGLILALMSDRHVTLVEADQRKAAFLRETARQIGATVTVIAERIEQSGLIDADIVTARAVAPLPRLLTLSAPILGLDGVAFFIKGANVDSELTQARRQWQMTMSRHAGPPASDGCVIEVRHLRRVEPS